VHRIALTIVFALVPAVALAETYYMSYREYPATVKRARAPSQLGELEEAHRLGLRCAQWGDKGCRWIVGILYLKGDGIEQNGLEGMKWMTVAVESGKQEWVEICDRVMAQLPEGSRAIVEQQGQEYIDRYGMRAQNVYCTRRADTGNHITRVVCKKQRWRAALNALPWSTPTAAHRPSDNR